MVALCLLSSCPSPDLRGTLKLDISWSIPLTQNPRVKMDAYPTTGQAFTILNEKRESGAPFSCLLTEGSWICTIELFDQYNNLIAGYLEKITIMNNSSTTIHYSLDSTGPDKIVRNIGEAGLMEGIDCNVDLPGIDFVRGSHTAIDGISNCAVNTVFVWFIDNNSVAIGKTLLYTFAEKGSHLIELRAYSADGIRKGTCVKTVSVSDLVVTGPRITNNRQPTWSWNAIPGLPRFRYCRVYGTQLPDVVPWQEININSHTPPAGNELSDGDHTLFVQLYFPNIDAWSESGSWTITIDTSPPTSPSISIAPGNYTANTGFYVTNYQYDPQYSLDNGTTWVYGTSGNLDMHHRYRIKAKHRDAAGNWAEAGPVNVGIGSWVEFCPSYYITNKAGPSSGGSYNCNPGYWAEVYGNNGTCDLVFQMIGGYGYRADFTYFINEHGGGSFNYPGGSVNISSTNHMNTSREWSDGDCVLSGGGGGGSANLDPVHFYRLE
jgi:hypothetical protein